MSPTASPRGSRSLAWIGVLLSTAALISYFTLSVKLPGLRDTAWLNLAAMGAGLAISITAFARRRSVWSSAGLALSTVWSVALLGFVFVLSNQLPPTDSTIAVGQTAPDFALADQNGQRLALSDLDGASVVLVFYRGFW